MPILRDGHSGSSPILVARQRKRCKGALWCAVAVVSCESQTGGHRRHTRDKSHVSRSHGGCREFPWTDTYSYWVKVATYAAVIFLGKCMTYVSFLNDEPVDCTIICLAHFAGHTGVWSLFVSYILHTTQTYSYCIDLYWNEGRQAALQMEDSLRLINSLRQTGDHPFTANSMHFRWGPWSFSCKNHWTLTSTKALDGGLNSAIMLHNPGSTWLNLTWLVLLVLTPWHFLWSDAGFTRKLELRQCQVQHQRWHCTGRLNFIGLPVSLSAEPWPNHLDISRWIKSPILAKHFLTQTHPLSHLSQCQRYPKMLFKIWEIHYQISHSLSTRCSESIIFEQLRWNWTSPALEMPWSWAKGVRFDSQSRSPIVTCKWIGWRPMGNKE